MAEPARSVERIWTPVELIRWTETYLAEKGIDEARLNAERLLASVLRLKRLELYLQFDRPLQRPELDEFKSRLRRRVAGEPLQYIEGTSAFRGLELVVDRRVLIPRPETELLVGEVLQWAAGKSGLDVLDVGTGSGAIALSIAQEGSFGRIVATDVSAQALEVARLNADRNGLAGLVELREGSVFEPVRGEEFDIVVSNPPYVGERERSGLAREVRDWEPAAALFAGEDGLAVLRQLILGARKVLRSGGLLALEIGYAQAAEVQRLIASTGGYGEPRVVRDLAGRDRFVLVSVG